VGAVHLNYVNLLDDQIALTAGTLGFQRLFTTASQAVGATAGRRSERACRRDSIQA
jgi:hypothetical protein